MVWRRCELQYPPVTLMTHTTDAVRILVEILQNNAASAHDIRGFIVDDQAGMRLLTELPDPEGQRIASFAHDAVWILHRHGAIDAAWLARLEHKYPHERRAINDVRRILSLPTRIEAPVSFDLLADNWAYETVAELYSEGPRDLSVGVVQVGVDELSWRGECWAGVALESLLSILSGVVLRDRFFVEERYIGGWLCEDSPVLSLHAGGMLIPFPEPEQVRPIRSELYRKLFHTPSLQRAHQKNIDIWRSTGAPPGGYDSQILWGSVGYLARSAALGVTYAGHPARRRFLAQTSLASGLDDAASITIGALDELRLRHFVSAGGLASSLLGLVVPPLLSDIIEEARTPEDLFRVALQHREQYRDLRRWLAHFQQALNDRDVPRIKEYHDAIDTFVQYATRAKERGLLRHDIASRTIQGLPGFHRAVAVLFERIVASARGERVVDKLLDLFEVSGTPLETTALLHLQTTVLTPAS